MLTLCLINTFPFFWLMKQAQDKSSLKPYVRTCIALVLLEQFWASKHFEQQALLVLWIPPPPKFEPWRKSLQVAPVLHPLPPPTPPSNVTYPEFYPFVKQPLFTELAQETRFCDCVCLALVDPKPAGHGTEEVVSLLSQNTWPAVEGNSLPCLLE